MHIKVLCSVVVPGLIAILFLLAGSCRGISEADVEGYLNALESFKTHSNESFEASCRTLTSAIKALLETVDARRVIQLDAPLFTFPHLRQDKFPVLVYFPCHRACQHVVIQRADGTLFTFDHYSPEEIASMMDKVAFKNETSSFSRKYLRHHLTHTVFFSLRYSRKKTSKVWGVTATYLLDNLVRVEVTV